MNFNFDRIKEYVVKNIKFISIGIFGFFCLVILGFNLYEINKHTSNLDKEEKEKNLDEVEDLLSSEDELNYGEKENLGQRYSKDNIYVYYNGKKIEIDDVKDNESTFQEGYGLRYADPHTFEVGRNGYAKDKNYVFQSGKMIDTVSELDFYGLRKDFEKIGLKYGSESLGTFSRNLSSNTKIINSDLPVGESFWVDIELDSFKINKKDEFLKNAYLVKYIDKPEEIDLDMEQFGVIEEKDIDLENYLNFHELGFYMGNDEVNNIEDLADFYNIKDIDNKLFKKYELSNFKYGTGNVSFDFETDDAGDYLLLMVDDSGFSYSMSFEVADFETEFTNNESNLKFEISSNFNLTGHGLDQTLESFFGSGYYDYNVKENSISINYRPIPGQDYKGEILLKSIYGHESTHKFDFNIEEIPDGFKFGSLYTERYNLVSRTGYWGDKIRLGFQNYDKLDLYIQGCELGEADFTKKGSSGIEEYFLDCNAEIQKVEYIKDDFEYWKVYDEHVSIPQVSDLNHYRISFFEDFRSSRYFTRSDIGNFVKLAGDMMYLFSYDMYTGKSLEELHIQVYDDKFENIKYEIGIDSLYKLDLSEIDSDVLLIKVSKGNDQNFIVLRKSGGLWYYHRENDLYKNLRITSFVDSSDIGMDKEKGNMDIIRTYGYTDRAIYKPGDEIYFAGFVSDIYSGAVSEGNINAILSHSSNEIQRVENLSLDEFGGFDGSFQIPKSAKLGDYTIKYIFTDDISYSHNIKIQEYQKPTYFVDTNMYSKADKYYLQIDPKYYFGENLSNYDIELDYSIVSEDKCWRCYWWSDKEYTYNHIFGNIHTDGGNFSYENLDKETFSLEIMDLSEIQNRGYDFDIKFDLYITDNNSDESRLLTFYEKIPAEIKIGLDGQSVDYNYSEDEYLVRGEIIDKNNKSESLEYILYKRDYGHKQEKGVDGSYYYIAGYEFEEIEKKEISHQDGNFSINLDLSDSGQYFLRTISYGEDGNINGETQKRIHSYRGYSYYGYWGDIDNNIVLDVNIPRKSFDLDEEIEINVNPYINDAKVIITVEKGNEILDTYEKTLDGNKITIPTKEEYIPYVNVSVSKLVPETVVLDNVDGENKRKEPRFMIGYAQANIDESAVKLNIDVEANKDLYTPGENVSLDVFVNDNYGNPVNAKVSLAVVDKALIDLYDIIKEPIPYFYNKVGSFISNFSNMKMLFDSLKVYTTGGRKGGGGGISRILSLRTEFKDTAYWTGSLDVVDGKANLDFDLPDNLTTWMIDVIGYDKNQKIGTNREYFQTKQAIMLNPNWPLFLTLGDSIKLPVNVVLDSDFDVSDEIEVSGFLEFEDGTQVDLGTNKLNSDSEINTNFDVYIPNNIYQDDWVKFIITASDDQFKDIVEWKIPIRASGFEINDFFFTSNKEGKHIFKMPSEYEYLSMDLSLSNMPINAFEEALDYLVRYPYGCTEQMLSGLYPSLLAWELGQEGLISENIVRGNSVNVGGTRGFVDFNEMFLETADKIYQNQKSDGGMGYRSRAGESSTIYLSSYVYSVFSHLESLGYQVDKSFMSSLESFLDKIGSNNILAYAYYIYNRTLVNKDINIELIKQIIDDNIDDEPRLAILAFAIFANINDSEQAVKYLEQIDLDKIKYSRSYSKYIGKDILQSIYLSSLIEYDFENYNQEIIGLVTDFLENRTNKGIWGWSTQKNMQIISSLSKYILKIKSSDDISCDITVDGEVHKHTLSDEIKNISQEIDLSDKSKGDLETSWNCNENLFIDMKTSYLPNDFGELESYLEGLSELNLEIEKDTSVGDRTILTGSFATTKDASQVAVEFFIPANIKLLGNISKFDDSEPFQIKGGRRCSPSHYESRFDRLFLYYDSIKSGTECEIIFEGINSFNGNFNIMPTRFFEMYDTQVHGRKVLNN
ncbi:MG2 domain-containing protein [Candidatus Vampirococcus lugosii]|uniref:Alpha-2-macroglobulin n=1 Tax=Candidatus Vampirococcus lugosii TaxID=2789015 RepID=A0ABS5QKE7_9BACT|nr:MG2 domain-containing protein [Candidatus Vampirococcus lugosii]MBS8121711.1 alpha-2-macroglobulin [Candidatus Vampirococcus lugosii]